MAPRKRATTPSTAVEEEVKVAPPAEEKAEAEAAATEEKLSAKTSAKKTASTKKETKETTKKAGAKKSASEKDEVENPVEEKKADGKPVKATEAFVVQFRGREVSADQISERFSDVWTKDYLRKMSDINDVTFYIKPEDSAVYFAVNNGEDTGSFAI